MRNNEAHVCRAAGRLRSAIMAVAVAQAACSACHRLIQARPGFERALMLNGHQLTLHLTNPAVRRGRSSCMRPRRGGWQGTDVDTYRKLVSMGLPRRFQLA